MGDRRGNGEAAAVTVIVFVLIGDASCVRACNDVVNSVSLEVIILANDVGESIPYIGILIGAQRCGGHFQRCIAVGRTGETAAVDTNRRRGGPAGNARQLVAVCESILGNPGDTAGNGDARQ